MSTTALIDVGSLITATPGVYGGLPRLARSGLPIIQLVAELRAGETIEDVMREFDLDPESAYAGLAFYLANKDALDLQLDERNADAAVHYAEWQRENGAWLRELQARRPQR